MSENLKCFLLCLAMILFVALIGWRINYCSSIRVTDMTGIDLSICTTR